VKVNHFIYQWERDAVQLRYDEGLCRVQIADRLGMRSAQVKYVFSKPNVKHYIQTVIIPGQWRQELAEIEEKLADPVMAYVDFLIARTEAQTYQWFGPGRKVYYSNNMVQFRANKKLGRIYGITGDQKTLQRDLRNAVHKYVRDLQNRRDFLRAKLALIHEN